MTKEFGAMDLTPYQMALVIILVLNLLFWLVIIVWRFCYLRKLNAIIERRRAEMRGRINDGLEGESQHNPEDVFYSLSRSDFPPSYDDAIKSHPIFPPEADNVLNTSTTSSSSMDHRSVVVQVVNGDGCVVTTAAPRPQVNRSHAPPTYRVRDETSPNDRSRNTAAVRLSSREAVNTPESSGNSSRSSCVDVGEAISTPVHNGARVQRPLERQGSPQQGSPPRSLVDEVTTAENCTASKGVDGPSRGGDDGTSNNQRNDAIDGNSVEMKEVSTKVSPADTVSSQCHPSSGSSRRNSRNSGGRPQDDHLQADGIGTFSRTDVPIAVRADHNEKVAIHKTYRTPAGETLTEVVVAAENADESPTSTIASSDTRVQPKEFISASSDAPPLPKSPPPCD